VLELRRRHLGEQLGELDGRRRRGLEEAVVEGQLLQLARRRVDQLLAAVADGRVSRERYESYLRLREEQEELEEKRY